MNVQLLRTVGVATAVYGVAVAVRPQLLARASGLVDAAGHTAAHTRTSLRPVGLRDAASGVLLAAAPSGPGLRTAALVRIAADLGDAVVLGVTLPRGARAKAVTVSLAWGGLSVAGLCVPDGAGRR